MSEKFTVFLRGPFSQWSRHGFTIDGIRYNTAEQYMMAEKARLFKDDVALKEIMKATHPRDQKAWGRKIKGFIKNEWEKIAQDVVYRASLNKFRQNPDIREQLFATRGTTLVEANPEDAIWGIALHESDPDCHDRSKWKGLNWLGIALTKARETLYEEEEKRKQ